MEEKCCYKCKNIKTIENFYKDKNKKFGVSNQCKICAKEQNNKYRINNLEYFQKYGKEYRKTYTLHEKYENYFKNYYQNILKSQRREQRKVDILFKIKCNIHSRTSNSLKKKNWKKNNTEHLLLGCTFEELKYHLESKFTEGMSWDNYGKFGWHIDHIFPLSLAKSSEELYKLSNYKNLQPLWAIDNIKKSNKII